MSAKSLLHNLDDAQLLRLFLDFTNAHRLPHEKTRKEISYKCHEATWTLPVAKATGYGRNEAEAYKNALKNLLELLMEDPAYVEYFSNTLSPHPQEPYPPKTQLKTEGHEPEDKQRHQYDTRANLNRPKPEVQHSKINLNRSMSQKGDPELD